MGEIFMEYYNMKKKINNTLNYISLGIIIFTIIVVGGWFYFNENKSLGATPVIQHWQGGTGTSTSPTNGHLLAGDPNGGYGSLELVAGTDITLATTTVSDGLGTLTISSTASADSGSAFAWTPTSSGVSTTTILELLSGGIFASTTVNSTLTVTGTITGNVTGALTGNASTATSLVANGANCSAGEIALGVDASGAVESCYEPTEADITNLNHFDGSDFWTYFNATNTDALSEGSTNFYANQTRWNSFWNASTTLTSPTSIPNLSITESQISDLNHTSFPWTPFTGGVSTSTLLRLDNGFISQASSTVDATLNVTDLDCTNCLNATEIDESFDWTGTIDGNNFTGGAVVSGDMLYGSGSGSIAELTVGASSTIMTTDGSTPFWIATSSLGFLSHNNISGDATIASGGALTISGNAVALGTDTTGNYVASITNGSGISGGDGGSEGAALTITATLGTAIDAGEISAGAIDGDDMNSNIAGRSLTLTAASPDTLDADTELYTRISSFNVASSTMSTTTSAAQHKYPSAITISRISCSTDAGTGTSTIQLDERAELTPNIAGTDVLTSVISCGAGFSNSSTGFDNAGIVADAVLNLQIVDAENAVNGDAPNGAPKLIKVHLDYTYDD